jgi:phage replication O-like protein O
MKNPWKRNSKINPQLEDGFRQINTDVLNALIKAKLTAVELSVVLAVISKTWGYRKKADAISISQLAEATGYTGRAIQKSNVSLIEKRILLISVSKRVYRGSPLNDYSLNKHYDTWILQDKKRVNAGSRGEQTGKLRVNAGTPTIYNIQYKRDILSYISPDKSNAVNSIENFVQGFIQYIQETKNNLAPKSDNLEKNSIDVVGKLIRLDNFTLQYVRDVMAWAVKDHFWSRNVYSLSGLRKKDDGLTKFQKIAAQYESELKPKKKKVNNRSANNANAVMDFLEGQEVQNAI